MSCGLSSSAAVLTPRNSGLLRGHSPRTQPGSRTQAVVTLDLVTIQLRRLFLPDCSSPLTSYVATILLVTAKMGWILLSASLCASWPTDG